MIAYLVARRSADAEAVATGFDTSQVSRVIRRGLTDSTYAPQARAALAIWRRTVPDGTAIPTSLLAWWYARFGARDSALVLLRRAVAERNPRVLEDASMQPVGSDPTGCTLGSTDRLASQALTLCTSRPTSRESWRCFRPILVP